jgi:hypothetical protein
MEEVRAIIKAPVGRKLRMVIVGYGVVSKNLKDDT